MALLSIMFMHIVQTFYGWKRWIKACMSLILQIIPLSHFPLSGFGLGTGMTNQRLLMKVQPWRRALQSVSLFCKGKLATRVAYIQRSERRYRASREHQGTCYWVQSVASRWTAMKNDPAIPARSSKKTGAKGKKEVREEVSARVWLGSKPLSRLSSTVAK